MKTIIIMIVILLGFAGCKKEADNFSKLNLIDLRKTPIGNFTLKDVITKPDSVVCGNKFAMGFTELYLNNSMYSTFNWTVGMYCGGISPTRIQAAVFPPYSLILSNNEHFEGDEKLYIFKNDVFLSYISISTVTVKDFIYTGKTLKFTCNDSWVRSGILKDYYIEINL